jgi:hypothetical protein
MVNMLGDFRGQEQQEGHKKKRGKENSLTNSNNNSDERNQLEAGEEFTSLVLCTQYEQMALERVLGKKRSDHMLESNKTTFLFF